MDVRVQPQFRLLDGDERRWIGIDKDRQQAKVAERSIGHTTRGNGEVALTEIKGQGPALGNHFEVIVSRGQLTEEIEQASLDDRTPLEDCESRRKVIELLR